MDQIVTDQAALNHFDPRIRRNVSTPDMLQSDRDISATSLDREQQGVAAAEYTNALVSALVPFLRASDHIATNQVLSVDDLLDILLPCLPDSQPELIAISTTNHYKIGQHQSIHSNPLWLCILRHWGSKASRCPSRQALLCWRREWLCQPWLNNLEDLSGPCRPLIPSMVTVCFTSSSWLFSSSWWSLKRLAQTRLEIAHLTNSTLILEETLSFMIPMLSDAMHIFHSLQSCSLGSTVVNTSTVVGSVLRFNPQIQFVEVWQVVPVNCLWPHAEHQRRGLHL